MAAGKETRRAKRALQQIRETTLEEAASSIREEGTVLATFVHAGEVVQPGQPLYRIANLDTLTLRAYVIGAAASCHRARTRPFR